MSNRLPTTLFAFILEFVRPYKWYVFACFMVAAAWGLELSLSNYMFKLIIDGATKSIGYESEIINNILMPSIGYVTLIALISVIFRIYDYVLLKFMPRLKADIWYKMYEYVSLHSHNYFQNNFSGSLVNKISDMANNIEKIISIAIDWIAPNLLAVFFACIALYSVHYVFTLLMLVWCVLFVGVTAFLSIKASAYSSILSEARSSLVGVVVDSVSNISNVRIFAGYDIEKRYINKYNLDVVAKDQKLQYYLLFIKIFQSVTIVLFFALAIILLIYFFQYKLVTIGDFALVLSLIMAIIHNIWMLANQFIEFTRDIGVCKQALSIITTNHEIIDKENASDLVVDKGEIQFINATFKFNRNDNNFDNQNITIKAGEKIGLVGFSGSGKTTFVNLIIRQYEIDGGQILIDNQNIADVTQNSLRESIGFIPQEPVLFNRTIMENIRYGRFDATDEEVIKASKLAFADEFITQMPEQYNTYVGERGVKMSGGQRQRIAIARAILKNAPILILDEATSALDSETESMIQESMENLMQNKTTLVIAHRLSTLLNMDKIMVFDKGHIIEQGTHEELINLDGIYSRLWSKQVGGFLSEKDE
jgi:ATP-binding cassette, subfamily B, bacterial